MNRTQELLKWAVALAVLWAVVTGWSCGPVGQAAWADSGMQWAWMKGASTVNQSGVYGTPGTPAAANTPGARNNAVSWTDSAGALWLFGGLGYDGTGGELYYNDLWKCAPVTGNWVWVKGGQTSQSGVYGTLGTAAAENTPGGRTGAVSWTDSAGALWLFGGRGYDSAARLGRLNDLWKLDPATGDWTWMKGPNTVNHIGTYGSFRKAAADNTPGGRTGAVAWADDAGGLWLFGGFGYDGYSHLDYLNDLWKYDPITNRWAWMQGTSVINQPGTYGTLGTPEYGNTPGVRESGLAWTDPSGAMWLFGGYGWDIDGNIGLLNDLWKYDPPTGYWAWVKGSSSFDQSGTYGTSGTAAAKNTPGARYQAVAWNDGTGAMWLFGGSGMDGASANGVLNDLWKYDPLTGNWTWMKGASTASQSGVYGTPGTAAAANTPGARTDAVSWTSPSGALWLFGGRGLDSAGTLDYCNDLWRVLTPDTIAPTGTVVINGNRSVTNSANVTLALTWADKGGSGTVRMKFSNDGATWTAWEALAKTRTWTLPAGEGYKTVRAMFRDAAGNNSAIYSDYIRVDTVPPTGSILINGGASSTKSRTVSLGLAWSDGTGSGVNRMRFSIDGATWTAWETMNTPRSYLLPAPLGYYTVRVQYLDAGNNYSAVYNDYIKLVAP